MVDRPAQDLESHVGEEIAGELYDCAARHGWSVRVPSRSWRAVDGYTSAQLFTLVIDTEQVVLKTLPDSPLEPEAYQRAAKDCPPAFRPHLVLQALPSWPTRSGGALMFQKLAGDDVTGCRSLATLPPERLVAGCGLIVDQLLRQWNEPVPAPRPMQLREFLRREIGAGLSAGGSLRRWAESSGLAPETTPWITLWGDPRVYPNPLALARDSSPLGDRAAEVFLGRRHGDLHLLNVLVPGHGDWPGRLDRFQLIDLGSYSSDGPLTSDPIFLVFSAIAQGLSTLPPDRWENLLSYLEEQVGTPDPGHLSELARTVFDTTSDVIASRDRGWTGEWRWQLRLSSLATAVCFTTFSRLGPNVRWWFFRLAARLGRALLVESGVAIAADGSAVRNPFRSPRPVELDRPVAAERPASALEIDRLVARAWRCAPGDESTVGRLLNEAYGQVQRIGRPGGEAAPIRRTDAEVARDRLRDLLDDATQILGADDPLTLTFVHRLASWTRHSGDPAGAVRLYQEAADRRKKVLGERHPDTKASWSCSRSPSLLDEATANW
jgi:hypothetical protein